MHHRLRTIVLDTNILVDNVHGYARWVDELIGEEERFTLVLPTIVVAEYLTAQEEETKEEKEKSKKYLSLFKKQDLTYEIAEILGQVLRRKTYISGASLADLIVAATAIYLNAPLATKNKLHFEKIPNLKFFKPEKI